MGRHGTWLPFPPAIEPTRLQPRGQLRVGHSNPYNLVPPVDIARPRELRFKDVAGGGFQSVALAPLGRGWQPLRGGAR